MTSSASYEPTPTRQNYLTQFRKTRQVNHQIVWTSAHDTSPQVPNNVEYPEFSSLRCSWNSSDNTWIIFGSLLCVGRKRIPTFSLDILLKRRCHRTLRYPP